MSIAEVYISYFYNKFEQDREERCDMDSYQEIYPIIYVDGTGNPLGLVGLQNSGYEAGNDVTITLIKSYNPKGGGGTSILLELCEKADKLNTVLRLKAEPIGDKNTIKKEKLLDWYGRFGFVGQNVLVRNPKS